MEKQKYKPKLNLLIKEERLSVISCVSTNSNKLEFIVITALLMWDSGSQKEMLVLAITVGEVTFNSAVKVNVQTDTFSPSSVKLPNTSDFLLHY